MTEDQGPDQVIRESCVTLIILVRLLQLKLIALKPLEIAEFGVRSAPADVIGAAIMVGRIATIVTCVSRQFDDTRPCDLGGGLAYQRESILGRTRLRAPQVGRRS